MCLNIISAPKVAEEDISCYKILEECKLEGYPYKSPFQENPIKSEIVYGFSPYVGEGDRTIKIDSYGYRIISEGYIHTYQSKIVAKEIVNYYQSLFGKYFHLFECKIPTGTEYYDGFDSNLLSGYASERIVFVKKLL